MHLIIISMKKYSGIIILMALVIFSGCKKKENNIINQAYEQPLKTYRREKSRINKIEKEHLKQLQSIEDSIK